MGAIAVDTGVLGRVTGVDGVGRGGGGHDGDGGSANQLGVHVCEEVLD